LPSLRVDTSTSGKITHYCFGANSGKMARSLKTTKRIFLFISVFGYAVSEKKDFLEIDQPHKRIAYGSHVC
jgi:hypothetical protein